MRFATIGLLLLGSLYVLSPTFLETPEVAVDSGSRTVEREDPRVAWFLAPVGEEALPEAAAVVEARARAYGAAIVRAEAARDRVIVYLKTGGRKEDVAAVATAPGEVALYDVDDLVEQEGLDARVPAPGASAIAAGFEVQPGEDGDQFRWTEEPPVGPSAIAISLDGRLVGTVPVDGAAEQVAIAWLNPAERRPAAILAGGPLPQPLTRWRAASVDVAQEEREAAQREPTWWDPLLPATRLNLGLDLQGGIDLTLQVDQDAAVYAAVQRDARVLQDQAVKAGLEATVRRDRTRPAILVASPAPYSELSAVVNKQLREYAYLESIPEGGQTFHVWRLELDAERRIRDQAVEQNLETLRKRVDGTGVKEPSIVKMDGGRINIQLPGVGDSEQAIAAIGTQATLAFRMVDEDADTIALDRAIRKAEEALPADQFAEHEIVNEWLADQGLIPEGRAVRWKYDEQADGRLVRSLPMMLFDEVVLTGADVDDASVGWDQNNIPRVLIDFKPRGANVFCEVTRANVGKQFAILLDEQIRSAPSIREAICGGSASIEMGTSADALDDANTLALVLRSGALTAPVDIGEVREIGASLGADAIASGRTAALAGGLLTLIFMALWYGKPGIIADVALILNVLLVFAMLALFGATLTLPGIAGVALTVGMAVDANIIIYERIREELKLGVPARKAVDAGYEKGVSAVLDANITTAIAGVVLYSYGTGPVRGFAVTLLIGIFTTLVTALFVTRTFMEAATRSSTARLRI